jgi:thymidylate synthase
VAAALGLPQGALVIYAKSAHVYEPELETMRLLTQIAV